jgi:hypothetical protein
MLPSPASQINRAGVLHFLTTTMAKLTTSAVLLISIFVSAGCLRPSARNTSSDGEDGGGAAGARPPPPALDARTQRTTLDAGRDSPVSSAQPDGGGALPRSDGGEATPPPVVDTTSLEHKMLFGYQGWFFCPGDGAPTNTWVHWFRNGTPSTANLTVDLWPDTSELGDDELYATQMKYADGSAARLYSAFGAKTVARHFAWMKDSGIDGVALQRFIGEVQDPRLFAARNQVAKNVRAGAEANGRVFVIEYDVTGSDEAHLVAELESDWKYMVDTLEVTASPRYLMDGGKPVLYLWGLGFSSNTATPADAQALIDWFTMSAEPQYRVTLVGGIPTHWRTLNSDSMTDPAWAAVYRSFDVLSPWTVGRYVNDAGADSYGATSLAPDLAAAKAAGKRYMPVVFPGFSWHNVMGPTAALNQIPRRGGAFYWRQVWNAVGAGATMLKTAMFDEVDEGTAMFKLAPSSATLPVGASLVPLDADGQTLPSDFYLRLGGAATGMLRGDLPLTATPPVAP